MFALFLTTTITCSQAQGLLNRIQTNRSIPDYVKTEILDEIRQVIPSCPVKIKNDGK